MSLYIPVKDEQTARALSSALWNLAIYPDTVGSNTTSSYALVLVHEDGRACIQVPDDTNIAVRKGAPADEVASFASDHDKQGIKDKIAAASGGNIDLMVLLPVSVPVKSLDQMKSDGWFNVKPFGESP